MKTEPLFVVLNRSDTVVGQEATFKEALDRMFPSIRWWVRYETDNFTIGIRAEGTRGWFEHNVYGDELAGGLWFDRRDGKLYLYDYDGVSELPREVRMALIGMGIDLTECYYDNEGNWTGA